MCLVVQTWMSKNESESKEFLRRKKSEFDTEDVVCHWTEKVFCVSVCFLYILKIILHLNGNGNGFLTTGTCGLQNLIALNFNLTGDH